MAGGMAIRWGPPPGTLVNTAGFAGAMQVAGGAIRAEYEANGKRLAPWTDRTGAARQSLTATFVFTGAALIVTLMHGVFYGIYLEFAHGGVWGVLPAATAATLPNAVDYVNAAIAGALA